MAVLLFTVTSYALGEYQIHKINTAVITELPGEAYLNAKVLLK